jgi:hypothetical protein
MKPASFALGLICVALLPWSFADNQGKPRRFQDVKTIYVKPADPDSVDAASEARKEIADSGCLQVPEHQDAADAILEITARREGKWIRKPFGGQRISASAILLDHRTKNTLWTDDRSSRWLLSSAAAGRAVADALIKEYGCDSDTYGWQPFKNLKKGEAASAGASEKRESPEPAKTSEKQQNPDSPSDRTVRRITLGMTPEQVEAALGQPTTRADLGDKVLYKHKDLTVEFHEGKVTDVR